MRSVTRCLVWDTQEVRGLSDHGPVVVDIGLSSDTGRPVLPVPLESVAADEMSGRCGQLRMRRRTGVPPRTSWDRVRRSHPKAVWDPCTTKWFDQTETPQDPKRPTEPIWLKQMREELEKLQQACEDGTSLPPECIGRDRKSSTGTFRQVRSTPNASSASAAPAGSAMLDPEGYPMRKVGRDRGAQSFPWIRSAIVLVEDIVEDSPPCGLKRLFAWVVDSRCDCSEAAETINPQREFGRQCQSTDLCQPQCSSRPPPNRVKTRSIPRIVRRETLTVDASRSSPVRRTPAVSERLLGLRREGPERVRQ